MLRHPQGAESLVVTLAVEYGCGTDAKHTAVRMRAALVVRSVDAEPVPPRRWRIPGTLTRWDPFADMAQLRGRFDRMLDEFGAGRERSWLPALDVVRHDDRLVVRADVPGIKPEEIKIEVRGGYLAVSGKHEETEEANDEKYVRRERRPGAFSRTIALPDGVEAEKIEAKTHDGVLEVTVPLPKEAAKEPVTITPTVG